MSNVNRAVPPAIKPIETFHLPSPRRETLSNGIPVFFFDNPNLDLIHLLLQVRTGSLYQPAKHVCNFAYTLLRESHPQLSAEQTSEKLDYYGTNVTVNVGMECVQMLISVPKNNIPDILPVIAGFLITPVYRPERLRIMQDKEIKNLAYNQQKTDYCAWRLMWREMLGDLFPSVSSFASNETLNALTTSQLQDFHRQSFCAENVTLFVTGNTDAQTEARIRDVLSGVPKGVRSPQLPILPETGIGGKILHQPKPDCLQSSIVLCSLSMGYNDPDRTGFSLLSTLTGGYFSSRLMQNLRERQGLTYGVSSSSTFFGNQSVFAISSDVNADQTQRALDACFEELQRLQDEQVGREELEMVKSYICGQQLRSADTSVNIMQKFAYWYRFGLDETEMYRYLAEIKDITPDIIQNLAKTNFLYNKFTQISVGKNLAEKECKQ
ncbi:MAG: insulinase family protein [Bacteroidales bacterium]|nr:insulinase family protein [Bacteroidales bacterium]